MVRLGYSFDMLDEDENELVRVVDEKAEDSFMAVVKEENKKIKAEEKKKKKKMEEEKKKKQVGGHSQNGADSEANGGQNYGGVDWGYYYQRRNYREGNGDYQGRSRSRVEEEGKVNNGGQNYGRANGGYHYWRRNHGEGSGDYQGRSQSGIEEEGRINNGGQNYGRVNRGYYRQRQNYRVVNGGNQGNNLGQKEEEVKPNNGVDNGVDGEGWQKHERRRRPDQGAYDQQRGAQGGFRDEKQGRNRWRGNDFQGRGRNTETENNNGDNNGVGLEKEKEAEVVEEKQEQEKGGVEEGKNAQSENNEVNGSSNKSSSDKKFGPNINGSLRRKLKKKKEAEAEKNQGNNGAAGTDGTASSDATLAVEKKFNVLFTLKEYEKKVLATKKEGVEVVSKSSDGDRERTETLVKEFESMQPVGKKKLVTDNNSSAPKMPGQSAEVDKKKDGLNLKKARALKTQTININEFMNQQKDGGFEGHHHSRSAPARKPHPSNGRVEGHRHSQTASVEKPPVEKPHASLKLDDGYEFPALGGKS